MQQDILINSQFEHLSNRGAASIRLESECQSFGMVVEIPKLLACLQSCDRGFWEREVLNT